MGRWYCEDHNQWCCVGCGTCPDSKVNPDKIDKAGIKHSTTDCDYWDKCPDCQEILSSAPGGWICPICNRRFDWYVDGKLKSNVLSSMRTDKDTQEGDSRGQRCSRMHNLRDFEE